MFLGPPAPGTKSGPGLVDRVLFCQPAFPKFLKGNSRGNRGREMCRSGAEYVREFGFFLAGPPKPSPGANSGDCGGFLSMVQGAWSKGRMKKCSHERFLRMVQGAWSKGHGPIGPYGPIVIGRHGSTTTRTPMVQGGMVQGGMVQVLLGGELRKFGYL